VKFGVNEKDHSIIVETDFTSRFEDCYVNQERYIDCYLELDRYVSNGRLCLSIYSHTEGAIARLTTNLPDYNIGIMEAFIDENNVPGAKDFLVENGFAKDLRISERSGYCDYPLVHLSLYKIIPYLHAEKREGWKEALENGRLDYDG